MYHPTSRVLTVLELLQSHPRLSGTEIALRLEVDTRTVRRYVAMLQDLGIPIQAEAGRYGGYRLRPGFKLPPLMFTDDEAMALTLGLLIARRLGLATAAPTVEGALAKVERVLPEVVREHVQALYETLVVDIPSPEAVVEGVIVGMISLAVQQQRRVTIRYTTGSVDTERSFDPYGVVCYGGRWYTAGYCHLRAGMRVFRLDRVRHVAITNTIFVPPANFDCLDYITSSFAGIPDIWDVVVQLTMPLEQARRALPASLVQLEPHQDGVLLRSSIDDLDMLARLLAGLGCDLVVLQPTELREAFHRLASRLAQV